MTERPQIPKLPPGERLDQATKRALLARLERDAIHLCSRFDLRYRVLEAERANVKRRYGVCYSDGTIRIRLRHAATARPLKYSSLVNTLCHELAHLKHFNHGPQFQAFYSRILECARREGIYLPRAAGGRDRISAPVRARAIRPAIGQTSTLGLSGNGSPGNLDIGSGARLAKAAQLELFGPIAAVASSQPEPR